MSLPGAPADVRALTPPAPAPTRSHRLTAGAIAALVGAIALIALTLVLVLGYFVLSVGPALFLLGAVLACVPLVIVLIGVWWIDRWEPEPWPLRLIAVAWGATAVILGTLAVVTIFDVSWAEAGLKEDQIDFLSTVVRAPILDEFGKGLGVLLIYLFARKWFDGPVDGIVYAALVAAGFAFTENIQYFAISASEGESLGLTFVIRGLMAPYGHVMYTACTGFAIGLAARTGRVAPAIGAFFVGLIPAILLHMLWNGGLSALQSDLDFFGFYFLLQVPLFLLAILAVVLIRRQEAALTRSRLGEYAAAGWLSPGEVVSLGTPAGRRAALAWASPRGLRGEMRGFIRDATQLAYARQRIITNKDRSTDQAMERDLLGRISATRARLAAAP